MDTFAPADFRPTVRVANYIPVMHGTEWGVRTIPDFELILVVRGMFGYETPAADPCVIRAGHVLCIPPLRPHAFRCMDKSKTGVISCIHGDPFAAGDRRVDFRPPLVTDIRADRHLPGLFRRCAEAFDGLSRCRAALLETIAREIWLRLTEHWGGPRGPALSRRMQRMVRFLREHLIEPISRRDLARAFALTPEHVNALFKAELGITPTQLIHRERVFLAYRLIHQEGLSVKQAADRAGFSDAFYFSKVFKKVMGHPPRRS